MNEIQREFEELLNKVRLFEAELHNQAKEKNFSKRPDYYSIIQSANSLALAKTYFEMYISYKDLEY